jgi:DnaJ-class molecular chaperone
MPDADKDDARKELNTKEARQMLRQFMNTDGPKGASEDYRKGWDAAFKDKCLDCDGWGEVGDKRQKCPTCDGTGKKVPPNAGPR